MVDYLVVDEVLILQLAGEININSLGKIRNRIESCGINQYDRIIVNLERVSFFDSSGLGYLVVLIKQIKMNQGNIVFCCPNSLVKRLLSTIRIEKYVNIHESQTEALEFMRSLTEATS